MLQNRETRVCEHCKNKFLARKADVKRGWARFCSKSCKALHQEEQTAQYAKYLKRTQRKEESGYDFPE